MMLSTCPSCLSQVSHQESVSQVNCTCGEKFSPFMRTEEWSNEMEDVSIGTPKYAESEAAFQDIRDFGDSLEGEKAAAPPAAILETVPDLGGLEPEMKEPVVAKTPFKPSVSSGEVLMTANATLPNHRIENCHLPISVLVPLSEGSESPLDEAFQKIWEKAVQTGANGLIELKWRIFPDGSRVLLTATPVTCSKT